MRPTAPARTATSRPVRTRPSSRPGTGGGRFPPPAPLGRSGDVMTDRWDLRRRILDELAKAGFQIQNGLIVPPAGDPKDIARQLHQPQRQAALEAAVPGRAARRATAAVPQQEAPVLH